MTCVYLSELYSIIIIVLYYGTARNDGCIY